MKLSARHVAGMLAVVVGALVVPAALAAPPDDSADPRGPGAVAASQDVTSVRPDDRAEARGPGSVEPVLVVSTVRPDDRAQARGPGGVTPTVVTTDPGWTTIEPIAAEPSGFDWTWVAVALIAGAVATLLVGAAIVTARHYEGPGRLAPH